MNLYTVIKEFSAPQLGIRLYVSDAVGNMQSRIGTLIDGTEYSDNAFYKWVGSADSLNYLVYVGTVSDPSIPGTLNLKSGLKAIGDGDDFVTVSGVLWDITPLLVLVTVIKPDTSDDNLFATVRKPSITSDGFTADLSSATTKTGYFLSYIATE